VKRGGPRAGARCRAGPAATQQRPAGWPA